MVIFEIAEKLQINVLEDDFTPFDLYAADEAFICGTSGSITPVCKVNGMEIGQTRPGPITLKLMENWNEVVGIDCVAQSLRHLGDNESKELLAIWKNLQG